MCGCTCSETVVDGVWVAEMDYRSPWMVAEAAAVRFNSAVEMAHWEPHLMLATAHVSATGEPVVWLIPEAAELLAELIEEEWDRASHRN